MVRVVSVAQMRAIDQQAVCGSTPAGYGYMRAAGQGIAAAAKQLLPSPSASAIAIVCGKGNNGGDGYEAGRLLLEAGYRVVCFGLYSRDQLRGEAALAFDHYAACRGPFRLLEHPAALPGTGPFALVIDAVLGIGLAGAPTGPAAQAIDAINACHAPVLAVDTPSGLDNDTGQAPGRCVKADVTVSMGFARPGTLFHPGRGLAGRLVVHDLGYPDAIVAASHSGIHLPDVNDMRLLLPRRKPAGSKHDHGVALMVCGSAGMLGSAALACGAALRSGCGMVHAAVPDGCLAVLAAKVTEPVLHAMAQTPAGGLAPAAAGPIRELAARCQAAAIGPGLTRAEQAATLVRDLVASLELPLLLDADGLNAFAGRPEALRDHRAPLVITPHAGEWQRLFGPLPSEPLAVIARVQAIAVEYRATVLLKGSPTIVAAPDGEAWVLPVGNSGMATAGSGDVLSGIVTSIMAQGADPTSAALLGAWLHGAAGDAAAASRSEYCMIASDIVEHLHEAFRSLLG